MTRLNTHTIDEDRIPSRGSGTRPPGFDLTGRKSDHIRGGVVKTKEYSRGSGSYSFSTRAGSLGSDNLTRRAPQPNGQAFGNRYDFGASLSTAIQAVNSALGERSGLRMKPSAKKQQRKFGTRGIPPKTSGDIPDLELAKKAEADPEANKQKRRFIHFQNGLRSHFNGKPIPTKEVEQSTEENENEMDEGGDGDDSEAELQSAGLESNKRLRAAVAQRGVGDAATIIETIRRPNFWGEESELSPRESNALRNYHRNQGKDNLDALVFKQTKGKAWKSAQHGLLVISSTISRDDTAGEHVRQAKLLAHFGQKRRSNAPVWRGSESLREPGGTTIEGQQPLAAAEDIYDLEDWIAHNSPPLKRMKVASDNEETGTRAPFHVMRTDVIERQLTRSRSLQHTKRPTIRLNSGPQPGMEKREPVTYNHTLSYVNKVKDRFQDTPEIYKQFLEILQTYQRESKPIRDVYAEVTTLFDSAPDLLEDFNQFLPESAAQAKAAAAAKAAEDAQLWIFP